jgi:hypothetical protein
MIAGQFAAIAVLGAGVCILTALARGTPLRPAVLAAGGVGGLIAALAFLAFTPANVSPQTVRAARLALVLLVLAGAAGWALIWSGMAP